MRNTVAGLLSAFGLCVLSGCGGAADTVPPGASGDCLASVRFHGVVYIVNTRVDQAAPKGPTIGPGAVVDCDHRTVVERVVVSSVKGVENRQAISLRGHYHGVYVAEDLPHSQWPEVVRAD